jgi:hypothetical protein
MMYAPECTLLNAKCATPPGVTGHLEQALATANPDLDLDLLRDGISSLALMETLRPDLEPEWINKASRARGEHAELYLLFAGRGSPSLCSGVTITGLGGCALYPRAASFLLSSLWLLAKLMATQ